MIQITVIKDSIVTNQASFPTQEEAQAWVDLHVEMGSFGSKAIYGTHEVLISPEVRGPVDELVSAATYDSEGNEINPALYAHNENGLISASVYETQPILLQAAQYNVEIVDITAQKAQESTNISAQAFLDSTDWIVTRAMERREELSSEFKAEREAARLSIVR